MKLITFRRYRDYVNAQHEKLKRRGMGPYYTDVEIAKICDWLKSRNVDPLRAVCHGARNGREVDDFKAYFPRLDIVGTDLVPFSGRSSAYETNAVVLKHDFAKVKQEWVGQLDFVYSNSLDHARDPVYTLRVWLDQLLPSGYLFLQHVINAAPHASGGDCFSATLDELLDMVNAIARVDDLLYVNVYSTKLRRRRACHVAVLVVANSPGIVNWKHKRIRNSSDAAKDKRETTITDQSQ